MDEKTQLCLIVEMEIEPNGVTRDVLCRHALAAAQRLVERGEVVGKTGATLVNHRAYVSPFVREFKKEDDEWVL